jgi:hypothetical protein
VPCRAGPPCRSGSPGPTLMPFGSCWTGPRHGGPQMGQGRAKHEIRETEEKSGSKMHKSRNSSYESLESTHHRNIHTSNSSHIKFLVGLSVGETANALLIASARPHGSVGRRLLAAAANSGGGRLLLACRSREAPPGGAGRMHSWPRRRAPTATSGADSLPRRPTVATAGISSPARAERRPLAEQISPPSQGARRVGRDGRRVGELGRDGRRDTMEMNRES